ncbi:MAG: thiol reductant ABC exporter subunit CydD [Chloroflexota bacterium]|jgi:ATP-binding cassette subfamily C protein CydD
MIDKRLWQETATSRKSFVLTIGLSILVGILTIGQAYFLSQIIGRVFLDGESLVEVRTLLGVLLLVILGRAIFVWLGRVTANYLAIAIKLDIRDQLFGRLLNLGPTYVQGERSGELTTTLVEGIEALDAYFSQYLPQLIISIVVPLTILFFVLRVDLLSAVILLVTAPLIPLFMILIGRAAGNLTNRQWQSLQIMSGHFLDVLQGLTTLKRLGQSKAQISNIARVSDQYRSATLQVMRVAFMSAFVLELLATISVAIIAVEIGLRLLNGNIAFVEALFILILAPEFFMPLRQLGARYHAGVSGVSAAERIFEVLDKPMNGSGITQPRSLDRNQTGKKVSMPVMVQLDDVYYTYKGEREALKGINMSIAPGETVVLVGASGSGKSTIVNLLLGFITPQKGSITVGGIPLQQLDPISWRARIAWVSQDPFLFNESVLANIRLARPGASLDEAVVAAKRAHAHTFIQSLPMGYETVVGEKGKLLSKGQAQRIALARAFLKDAPFLIMDEPASNLDPELEDALFHSTRQLMVGRSTLIIAHRISTATRADRIIVLDKGQVVESGRHQDLLAQAGYYHQLVTN